MNNSNKSDFIRVPFPAAKIAAATIKIPPETLGIIKKIG